MPERERSRIAALGTALTLTLTTIAACGGGGGEAAGGKVTLTLGYYAEAGGPADGTMRKLVDQFTKANPGIEVKIESADYDQFYKRLRTQLAGGQAPDVWLSDGVLVQEFSGRNSLRDLTKYASDLDLAGYYGIDIIKKGDPQGRLFGFPQGAQSTALFYNKAIFAKAGVEPPTADWTYDDLLAAAKKLTQDTNGDGKTDVYGFRAYSPSFVESWWPMVKAFGGDVLADNGKIAIDSPQSREALTWMNRAMYEEKIAPDPVTTEALGKSQILFPSGIVAMQFGIYARIQTAAQGKIDMGAVPLPKGPTGQRGDLANINSWVVNRASSEPEAAAAWKWIKFFAGEGPQAEWMSIGEAIPINKKVAQTPAFLNPATPPTDRRPFTDALADADDLGLNPVWSEYTAAITKQVTAALSKQTGIEDALKIAQTDAQAVVDRFKPAG
ncbi:ABC transporter substrate-binding protein [Nonomuraea angiospora]|uniref:Multiple sugar transport system substrate-binding protein n=1 Tax=Nonomuraea angiospora TaxID=46172 RepID=A0ABR9LWK7_9ACTN|nr:sugar ABC transporter substrate-binding protein [Nonomuraea angiospora]MBE1584725.1 multiple sugar transport system substrate-binding protein [Nonomuraea angiospora]